MLMAARVLRMLTTPHVLAVTARGGRQPQRRPVAACAQAPRVHG